MGKLFIGPEGEPYSISNHRIESLAALGIWLGGNSIRVIPIPEHVALSLEGLTHKNGSGDALHTTNAITTFMRSIANNADFDARTTLDYLIHTRGYKLK